MKRLFLLNDKYAVLLQHTNLKTVQHLHKWLSNNNRSFGDKLDIKDLAVRMAMILNTHTKRAYVDGFCYSHNRNIMCPVFMDSGKPDCVYDKIVCMVGAVDDIIEYAKYMQEHKPN